MWQLTHFMGLIQRIIYHSHSHYRTHQNTQHEYLQTTACFLFTVWDMHFCTSIPPRLLYLYFGPRPCRLPNTIKENWPKAQIRSASRPIMKENIAVHLHDSPTRTDTPTAYLFRNRDHIIRSQTLACHELKFPPITHLYPWKCPTVANTRPQHP